MSVFQPGNIAYGFTQSLIGVPVQTIIAQRVPTSNDKAPLGTFWINQLTNLVYVITSIVDNVANWSTVATAGSVNQFITDSGSAFPSGGIINVFGGDNIMTSGSGNTIDVATTPNIDLPATNAAGTQGIYKIGGVDFGFMFPPTSVFVGNAGNTTSNSLLAINNVGMGNTALHAVTSGSGNTGLGAGSLSSLTSATNDVAVGFLALASETTGSSNVAVGAEALQHLLTGQENVAVGFSAGINYTGAESDNICISNQGTLGESNAIRLGTQGTGAGQQNATYIAGIYNTTFGGTYQVVQVDNTGKIGSSTGTDGEILIGSSVGSPVWNTITAGTNVSIVNGHNTIDISVPDVGIEVIDGNTGSAAGSTISIIGNNNITTTGDDVSTLTLNLTGTTNHAVQIGNSSGSLTSISVGTTGQVLTGNTAANPAFAALGTNSGLTAHSLLLGQGTSAITALGVATNGQLAIGSTGIDPVLATLTAGSGINITNGAGSITVASTITQGIVTINGNSGSVTGTTVTVGGGSNITTSGSGTTLTVGVSGTTNHSLLLGNSGGSINNLGVATNGQIPIGSTGADPVLSTITAGSGITVTNGAGSITIAASGGGGGITTIDGDTGSATGSTVTFDTNYPDAGASVRFIAAGSGVSYLNTDSSFNVFIGQGAAGNLAASGSANTALGREAMFSVTSGGDNVSVGARSLFNMTSGSSNIVMGFQAGINYTSSESNNILFYDPGTTGESGVIRLGDPTAQNTCYVAGVAGVTVSNSATVLINTVNGQLGTVVSSRRYKENINDMGVVSQSIIDLRPVTFNLKNDKTYQRQFGLIAEEVDEIFPDLVVHNKSGDPESVKYHDLPVLLLNELQRQHNLIADLSRRLIKLEERAKYEPAR